MDKSKFLYGLSEMVFNGKTIGYIEKDSFDWGGSKGESVDVNAEQVPDAPVLTLQQSNGTVAPTFNLIQLDAENLAAVLGGTTDGETWNAPKDLVQNIGRCEIKTPNERTITIPKAQLSANLGGKLSLSEVSKVECQLKVLKPDEDVSPVSISKTVAPGG